MPRRATPSEAIDDDGGCGWNTGDRTALVTTPNQSICGTIGLNTGVSVAAEPRTVQTRKSGRHGYPRMNRAKHVICHTDGPVPSY